MALIEGVSKGVLHDTRKQPIRLMLEKYCRTIGVEQALVNSAL